MIEFVLAARFCLEPVGISRRGTEHEYDICGAHLAPTPQERVSILPNRVAVCRRSSRKQVAPALQGRTRRTGRCAVVHAHQRQPHWIAPCRSFSGCGPRHAEGDCDVQLNSTLQRTACDRTIFGTVVRLHIEAQRQASEFETCTGLASDPARAGGNCDAQEPRYQSNGSALHQDCARRFEAVGKRGVIPNSW